MECNNYLKCSAPICIKDNNHNNYIWFPNEEICNQSNGLFIKNQRKIKQKSKDSDTCFTFEMLNKRITIRQGITGINPEKEINSEEMKWISRHPEKKVISNERKKELQERMRNVRMLRSA